MLYKVTNTRGQKGCSPNNTLKNCDRKTVLAVQYIRMQLHQFGSRM